MSTIKMTAGEIAERLSESVKSDLQKMVKQKLLEKIDATIEELATEIAQNIMISMKSYETNLSTDPFGPKIVLHLQVKDKTIKLES